MGLQLQAVQDKIKAYILQEKDEYGKHLLDGLSLFYQVAATSTIPVISTPASIAEDAADARTEVPQAADKPIQDHPTSPALSPSRKRSASPSTDTVNEDQDLASPEEEYEDSSSPPPAPPKKNCKTVTIVIDSDQDPDDSDESPSEVGKTSPENSVVGLAR
jgi:hypothetical protein